MKKLVNKDWEEGIEYLNSENSDYSDSSYSLQYCKENLEKNHLNSLFRQCVKDLIIVQTCAIKYYPFNSSNK